MAPPHNRGPVFLNNEDCDAQYVVKVNTHTPTSQMSIKEKEKKEQLNPEGTSADVTCPGEDSSKPLKITRFMAKMPPVSSSTQHTNAALSLYGTPSSP